MDIIYEKGTLLNRKDLAVIGHPCNCVNSMGAGISKLIKIEYPEAYEIDQDTIQGDKNKLGTFTITKNTTPKVANIYSQYAFGKNKVHLNYEALASSLEKLAQYMLKNKFYSLGLPYLMGCGLAGGNWQEVEKILVKFAKKYKAIQVYLVELENVSSQV